MPYTIVHGSGIEADQPGCAHWRTERDVIAIKFPCCGHFFACYQCHEENEGHAPERWLQQSWAKEKAILCRACGQDMTIKTYMNSDNACPNCAASFNPGCKNHWDLYFIIENSR